MAGTAVVCREASLGDYEGISGITSNYLPGGLDYLPQRYHAYINNPHKSGFVLETDGRIVCFLILFVVDDGESGVEEAKRTHPDYQGQGLMKTLDRYAKENTLQRHPGIKRWKIGTYQRHIVNSLLNAPNSMYWVQERKHIFEMRCTAKSLISFNKFTTSSGEGETITPSIVRTLELPEALETLMSADWKTLAPSGVVVTGYIPYKPTVSNFEKLLQAITLMYSPSEQKEEKDNFSFGDHLRLVDESGFRYYVDFYGKGYDNIFSHFVRHLQYATKFVKSESDKVILRLYRPLTEDRAKIVKIIAEVLQLDFIEPPCEDGGIQYMIAQDREVFSTK